MCGGCAPPARPNRSAFALSHPHPVELVVVWQRGRRRRTSRVRLAVGQRNRTRWTRTLLDWAAALSGAVFSNYGYDAALEDERQFKQPADEGGGRISVRQFQVGDALMTCREYLPRDRWWWVVRKNPPLWEVDCLTTRESGAGDLSASFIGQKEDVPSFYRIIDRIEKAD